MLLVNVAQAPELKGVRREAGKKVRKVWREMKRLAHEAREWEREEGIGEWIGKVRSA